ncbi:MAG: response regulator [Planctomycetaceae bacterium]|jgi:CheY-like chemotaxis protein|nr:response regulator [Planctomycetaceae bacterium]
MKHKILIADDNIVNVELLDAYLAGANYKNFDYEIITAFDGAETLEKATKELPDLILLDIMMPKMSGFEVCEKIRANPKTKNIMILMVTALSELGDIERAVAAGCDDYLSKPVNKFELIKRVENMLKLSAVTNELERLKQYINEMEK